MENTRENHPRSTRIKVLSNFVLNNSRSPDKNKIDQSVQENTGISSQNQSSNTEPDVVTVAEYEETVEFNYLTGAYEKVKKKKEPTTLDKVADETTQENNKTINMHKCFYCNFTTNYSSDLKSHMKKHSNQKTSTKDNNSKSKDNSKVQSGLKNNQQQHQNSTKIILPKIRQKFHYYCYHCDFKISSKELLKYHALKYHYKLNFLCKVHSGKKKNCTRCIYQQTLTNLKEDLRICENCGFKTCREATFIRHKNECNSKVAVSEKETISDNNDENVTDSEEEYSPFKNGQNPSKTIRKILSDKVTTNNVVSQTASVASKDDDDDNIIILDDAADDTKNEDIVEEKIDIATSSIEDETEKKEPTIQYYNQYTNCNDDADIMSLEANNYDYICYDCPFKAYMEADYLTNHAEIHEESTFTCFQHTLFKIFCKRCIYQYALMSIKLKKIICKYCPKKFDNLDSALIHMRGNCSEQLISTEYLLCYDCGLKPTNRQELFKHAARHKSNYQCFEHEQPKLKTCSKCLYEFLVKSQYKCFKCECTKIKSEFELRSHIESKHSNNTVHPRINCNKHSETSDYCRQCVMKQICDEVYLQKICPICKTKWTFLKVHISTSHKNVNFICHIHPDRKEYGKCRCCYAEKILESQEKIYNCRQCVFRCNSREEFELHIVLSHSLETFMCQQHSLGDIQSNCDMCAYETVALKLSQ